MMVNIGAIREVSDNRRTVHDVREQSVGSPGGQVVAGSNPVSPTVAKPLPTSIGRGFVIHPPPAIGDRLGTPGALADEPSIGGRRSGVTRYPGVGSAE